MASNDKTVLPQATEAASSTREENKTMISTSKRGLMGLPSSPRETSKREEILQKVQVDR